MRVVVLGGAGEMGSRAVEDLAFSPEVEEVAVADRDTAGARRVMDALADPAARLTVRGVDAADHDALVRVLRDYDVAASALGPFYLFESRLVAASLEAGTDYVSICDDWSATLDVMVRFDERAREAGVRVITGCGASPGLSNVAARLLADKLERLERMDVYVFVPMSDSSEGVATIMHTLFVYGVTVPVFRDGVMEMLPAGAYRMKVEFPAFGPVRVWNVGHSEPVTLPRFFPHLREVNMMMGLGRGCGPLVAAGRLGLFKTPRRREVISRAAAALMRSGRGASMQGALRVDATGLKDGCTVTLTACGTGAMRDTTGTALSVGAQLLGKGNLTVRGGGVLAPEGCFDPYEFFGMMRERGTGVYADLAMTEAWC